MNLKLFSPFADTLKRLLKASALRVYKTTSHFGLAAQQKYGLDAKVVPELFESLT